MVKRANRGWCERFERIYREEFPDVMQDAMLKVESEAKRVVYLGHPDHLIRRSGTLGRSITTTTGSRLSDRALIATTGTNVVYAPTHEFGDDRTMENGKVMHIPARPFLIPSFQAKKEEVKKDCENGLVKILRKVKIQ